MHPIPWDWGVPKSPHTGLLCPPLQHLEVRKHMDADNIIAWEAPEVGDPAPGWVSLQGTVLPGGLWSP